MEEGGFMIIDYLFFILGGYLLGSILFGERIPRRMKGIEIRETSSDGNPGTANAFLCGGFWCGMLVLFCDLLKGFLPVWLAASRLDVMQPGFALVLAAPVAGHAFPAGSPGKGGKAIAVSFGVLLGLVPHLSGALLLAAWYLFFSLVVIVTPHSYRTADAYICWYVSVVLCRLGSVLSAGAAMISLIVLGKHAQELQNREERQVHFCFRKE